MSGDVWAVGEAYEAYVGRWSRLVARAFLAWLEPAPRQRWLDVGCGTGALTAAVLAQCDPVEVVGVDRSEAQAGWAAAHVDDPRARFVVADASHGTRPAPSIPLLRATRPIAFRSATRTGSRPSGRTPA